MDVSVNAEKNLSNRIYERARDGDRGTTGPKNVIENGTEGKRGKREREAVFQAIHHKRRKTRLTLNGRGREPRDATCTLVLISPDVARAGYLFDESSSFFLFRSVFFSPVLFTSHPSLKRAALARGSTSVREVGDGKIKIFNAVCVNRFATGIKKGCARNMNRSRREHVHQRHFVSLDRIERESHGRQEFPFPGDHN